MAIRDNVRQRRRERIAAIIGTTAAEREKAVIIEPPAKTPSIAPPPTLESDPELWWKNRQREVRQSSGTGTWPALGSRQDGSMPPQYLGANGIIARFARSFLLRLIGAIAVFAACWGWIRSDIPGGEEARQWTVRAVTQDMDFEAAEAWYGQTFGGSASFLPSFRGNDPAAEVSAGWSRDATVLPVDGRVVQTFAQSDTGVIQIAAPLGSGVLAVHAGRVTQVTTDNGGKATIIVQHSNRVMTVYGDISSPVVKTNDWVQAGQKLGLIGTSNEDAAAIGERDGEGTLRFAVKQNNNYLDPAEVIPFD